MNHYNEPLTAACDNARDAMFIFKNDETGVPGNFTFVNKSAALLLGYTQEELLALSPVSITAPGETGKFYRNGAGEPERESSVFETTLRARDGSNIPAEISVSSFKTGGEDYVFVTVRDITRRKHIEEDMLESMEYQELITSQLPAILWTTDRELRLDIRNNRFLNRVLQKNIDNVQGLTIYERFQTTDPGHYGVRAHLRALQGYTEKYYSSSGGRDLSCVVRPLKNRTGEIIGTVGIAWDVTEQKHTEAELRKKVEELELLEDQLPVVIALMDKDLRYTRVYGKGSPRFNREKKNMIGKDLFWYFKTDDPDYEPIRKC